MTGTLHALLHHRFQAVFEFTLGIDQLGQNVEAREQLRGTDALGDQVGSAGRFGAVALLGFIAARDHHHRQVADAADLRLADAPKQAVTVELGHGQVGDHDAYRRIDQERLPRFLAIQGFAEFEHAFDALDQRGADDA